VDKRRGFTLAASYEILMAKTIRRDVSFFDRNKLNIMLIPYKLPVSLTSRDRVATMTSGHIRGTWQVFSNQDSLEVTKALVE